MSVAQVNPASHRAQRSVTVGLRVTAEEKALLQKAAGKDGLPVYLRRKLLSDTALSGMKPPRKRCRKPVADGKALGQVLAALGRSGIPDALERLLAACGAAQARNELAAAFNARSHDKAAPSGNVPAGMPFPPSPCAIETALLKACADIAAMRVDLVKALGLQARADTDTEFSGGSQAGNGRTS